MHLFFYDVVCAIFKNVQKSKLYEHVSGFEMCLYIVALTILVCTVIIEVNFIRVPRGLFLAQFGLENGVYSLL